MANAHSMHRALVRGLRAWRAWQVEVYRPMRLFAVRAMNQMRYTACRFAFGLWMDFHAVRLLLL